MGEKSVCGRVVPERMVGGVAARGASGKQGGALSSQSPALVAGTLPPARPHPQAFPHSATNRRPSVQMAETVQDISYLNHHNSSSLYVFLIFFSWWEGETKQFFRMSGDMEKQELVKVIHST